LRTKYDQLAVHQVLPIFSPVFGKKRPSYWCSVGKGDYKRGKLSGKNSLGLKAFGGLLLGGKICRILANRAKIERILHRNRKEAL
jgi:hypothetical protein